MKSFNNQFATQKLREVEEVEEQSVTGGGEAYLPGLDVPEKKYKGPKESEVHDGYEKVKGFKKGHTKDKGGFLYKDLWNVNEEEIEEALTKDDYIRANKLLDRLMDKDYNLFMALRKLVTSEQPHPYSDFEKEIGDEKLKQYGLAEDQSEGQTVVINKKGDDNHHKRGTIVSSDGGYYKIQFPKGNTDIFTKDELEFDKPKKSKEPPGPKRVLDIDKEEFLKENYSRFKKETATRTNEQQLHSAMRLAEKKIKEANKILEYTSQLRGELYETKAGKHTQKVMERITVGIAEAYRKMKKMK